MGARNRVRTGDTPAKRTGAHEHVRGISPAPITSFSCAPPAGLAGRGGNKEDVTGSEGLCDPLSRNRSCAQRNRASSMGFLEG